MGVSDKPLQSVPAVLNSTAAESAAEAKALGSAAAESLRSSSTLVKHIVFEQGSTWMRYFYRGSPWKDARVLKLPDGPASVAASGGNGLSSNATGDTIDGLAVLQALRSDGQVDLSQWMPCVYSWILEGWAPVTPGVTFELPPLEAGVPYHRIDIQLFPRDATSTSYNSINDGEEVTLNMGARNERRHLPSGYFQIGIVGAKGHVNLGTLWRSAYSLGAAGIFVIASRLQSRSGKTETTSSDAVSDHVEESPQHGTSNREAAEDLVSTGSRQPAWRKEAAKAVSDKWDTYNAWGQLPMCFYADWNHFAEASPYSAALVAVEMGGEPLETFQHPDRAIYILGAEDTGLPKAMVRACHKHVALPSERAGNFNVAVAGSIIMYDRLAKSRTKSNSPN